MQTRLGLVLCVVGVLMVMRKEEGRGGVGVIVYSRVVFVFLDRQREEKQHKPCQAVLGRDHH